MHTEQERGYVVRSIYGLEDIEAGRKLIDEIVELAREVASARIDIYRSLETPGLLQFYECFPDEDAAARFRADPRTAAAGKAWRELTGGVRESTEWTGISLSQPNGLSPRAGDYFVNPRLRAKPGEVQAITDGLRRDAAGMHEAGRIVYFELNVSRQDPLDLMFSARWRSQAHWAAHQAQVDYPTLLARLDGGLVRSLWEAMGDDADGG